MTASEVEFKARYIQMSFPSSLYSISIDPISHLSIWAHLMMWHVYLDMKDFLGDVASYVA